MKKRKIMTITAIALIIVIVSGAVIWKMLGIRAEGESTQIDTSKWDTENRVNIVYDTEGIPVPVPKGYTASSLDDEHTVNNGFVIYEGEEAVTEENKDSAQSERNQWVWVPVTNMSDMYSIGENGRKYNVHSGLTSNFFREPDIVENSDRSTVLPRSLAEENQNSLNYEFQNEFEYTINSIEKYGGFYIGRYETGDLSQQKAKVVRNNLDIHSQTWYTMYRKSKELMQFENKNVRTSMIWGNLWDKTLEWFISSGSKTYSDFNDSISWGNYEKSTVEGHGSIRPTGYSEIWKANNIYDLAGNAWEWTLETSYWDYRTIRGGSFNTDNYGYNHSVNYRHIYGFSYSYPNYTISRDYKDTNDQIICVRYACYTIYKVIEIVDINSKFNIFTRRRV